MSTLRRVVIVGRPNVGKSTLFNRLSSDIKSIAYDYAGVTRDFLKEIITWDNHTFDLIDTGGMSMRRQQDDMLEQTRQVALALVKTADVVLFVCDGISGLLPEDREIAKELHKLGKPVVMVVNKMDNSKAYNVHFEFERLGHGKPLDISAQHARGIAELLEAVVSFLPKISSEDSSKVEVKPPKYKIVLLGKPNVGKSSLMNLLLKQERSIVRDEPGTTREAIAERITFYQEDLLLTDTPGIRRKRSIDEPLEQLMVRSSFRALDRADIVLMLIDASEKEFCHQELKLMFYAFNEGKAVILLFNKTDLSSDYSRDRMIASMDEYKHFMKKIVSLNISCLTGQNIGKILPAMEKVWSHHSHTFDEDEITNLFKEALERKPLYHNTMLLALRRVKQIGTAPITLLMIVNVPDWFGSSQLTFFENILRKHVDLKGAPVRFVVRKTG